MCEMTNDYKEHYKETTPEETVEKLICILNKMGIEVEENWMEDSEIGTCSMRLTIKGTDIGTNGKGVSRRYARASAYAEFFERFQNDLLWGDQWFSNLKSSPEDVKKSAEELIQENSSFIEYYFKAKGMEELNDKKKVANFLDMEKVEEYITNEENSFTSTPFYNVSKDKIEYLPRASYILYYGSNGMCAGNTREEALVQGIAEIIERVSQKRTFEEAVTFPDIPEEEIKKYPYIWDMFKKVKEMGTVEVALKDCSFGGKYPVVALLVIQKNTGLYGMKFGCHPIISIAMERALTEAAQGRSIIQYATSSKLDFSNKEANKDYNIENAMKVGIAQYPYQIFNTEPTYEYSATKDYTGYSNAEILKSWLCELKSEGYNVLIRDVSYLGFPTYQIIIPGLSESRRISDSFSKSYNTRLYASWLLKNIEQVNSVNCKYIYASIEKYAKNIQENKVKDYFGKLENQKLPAEEFEGEGAFLCALSYFVQGQYDMAEYYIEKVAEKAVTEKSEQASFYIAVRYYINAIKRWNDHEKALFYIKKMFSSELADTINQLFVNKEQVLQQIYGNLKTSDKKDSIEYTHLDTFKGIKNTKKIEQSDLKSLCLVS